MIKSITKVKIPMSMPDNGNPYKIDNSYDDSRPLDIHVWTDHSSLLEVASIVWATLFNDTDPNRGKREQERFNHLRLVLTDLFKMHTCKDFQYLGYSRNKNSYNKESRYNDLAISYAPMMHIVTRLIEHGFIEHQKGVHAIGKQSRMKPSEKLTVLFNAYSELPLSSIERIDDELVILKELKDKKTGTATLVEYQDDGNIVVYRENLKKYNALLESTDIVLDQTACSEPVDPSVDLTSKRVKRIFNDGKWDCGGRFYGGWWQRIRREQRKHIKINGQRTVEIDYKAFHVALLYSLLGYDYFKLKDDDPYSVDGYAPDEVHRNFFKIVLLVVLNSSSELSAIRAVTFKTNSGANKLALPHDIDSKTGIKQAIKSFSEKHKLISNFFYTNVGKMLQFHESEIAESVLVHFAKKSVPILCIHDSFICSADYKDELYYQLKDSFSGFHMDLDIDIQLPLKVIG